MNFGKIQGFHWITKTVMLLTLVLLGMIAAAAFASFLWAANPDNRLAFNISQGLGSLTMAMAWLLVQAFMLIFIAMILFMSIVRVKEWIEKYLDAMLAKLDLLTQQKKEPEEMMAALATMGGKINDMEKKLGNIERILEKVAD
jgi:hypothetical protein